MPRLDELTNDPTADEFTRHRLAWTDFDALAHGTGRASVVRVLRAAERSRRLLLVRAIVEEAGKIPDLATPLPPADDAWELLARAQHVVPDVLDLVLAHPYTGSWAGYTIRLLQHHITGVGPLWVHVGYVHALAAAAGIRAGIPFRATVPVWRGYAHLPTLGAARLDHEEQWTTAEVHAGRGRIDIDGVYLPTDLTTDTPTWWPVRRITAQAGGYELAIRLDDVDPYRGPYEPLPPQRIGTAEVVTWRSLLVEAWGLIRRYVPDLADMMRVGFDSVVPRPLVTFRTPSATSDDAFGSAVIARPPDPTSLAAIVVHEFQHSVLGALSRLVRLSEPDPRERHYTGWRDDPRPTGGVLQGLFAFFGVTALWRALARAGDRMAIFEFAYHRMITWEAVEALRHDSALTAAGRRLVAGVRDTLEQWQDEPVPAEIVAIAERVAVDHRLGWRLRYLPPDANLVADLASAWSSGRTPEPLQDGDPTPSLVPDGSWAPARADLCRLLLSRPESSYQDSQGEVPDATPADFALATDRFGDAIRYYRTELAHDPDRPSSWAGLALALVAAGASPAGRMLTQRPELVRAVHRALRGRTASVPTPEHLAAWLASARFLPG